MRSPWKIIERNDSRNHRRQRGRDLRILHVCDIGSAGNLKLVNFHPEGLLYLPGVAGKFDDGFPSINFLDRKALRTEPAGNRLNVSIRRTVICAKSLRR